MGVQMSKYVRKHCMPFFLFKTNTGSDVYVSNPPPTLQLIRTWRASARHYLTCIFKITCFTTGLRLQYTMHNSRLQALHVYLDDISGTFPGFLWEVFGGGDIAGERNSNRSPEFPVMPSLNTEIFCLHVCRSSWFYLACAINTRFNWPEWKGSIFIHTL